MYKFALFSLSNPYIAIQFARLSIYFAFLLTKGKRAEELIPDISRESLCKISKISLDEDWEIILNMTISELHGCQPFQNKSDLRKEILKLEKDFKLVFSDNEKHIINKDRLQKLSNFCNILSHQVLLYRCK